MLRWLAVGGVTVAVVAAIAVRSAGARWQRQTAELSDRIVTAAEASGVSAGRSAIDLAAIDAAPSLPEPVRRYFRATLRRGQGVIRAARLDSAGSFRQVAAGDGLGPEAGWMPFTATQTFTADPPAFVWAARMRMFPLVDVYVRDGYVNGRGSMQAAALGLVTVVDARDAPGLDAGALLRYLAEAAWFPTALLPGPRLTWTGIDATHARATLRHGPTEAAAIFEFDAAGDIVTVSARRPMAAGDGYVLTSWQGRFWQHMERDGLRIPLQGEVAWLLDGEWRPYWRGQIVHVEYGASERATR
jgi:hypothetical protein